MIDTTEGVANLTSQQQAVVNHRAGNAKVIAVAGAGKTTTLTHFIAARLADGVPPRRLLVLMYNKTAQTDFEDKLTRLLPNRALPKIRTFHSLGLRIYHSLVERGYLPEFQPSLINDYEMETVVWRFLQQCADEDTRQDILSQRKKWVEPALAFIDRVKCDLLPASDIFAETGLPDSCRIFIQVFELFEDWRKQQQRITFADMLYDPVNYLKKNPDVAQIFRGHMQWILVDEYQDINAIQQYLLNILYDADSTSLMVIGDPDQTIYEFRGSRPEFISDDFDQQFSRPNQAVVCYKLPHTFRYGHALSLLANHLITNNKQRPDVLCISHQDNFPTKVQLHLARYEPALVKTLVEAELKHREAEEIAIIHRVWALCAGIELALLQADIPYQLHNSQSVLDRWELKIFRILFAISDGVFGQQSVSVRQQSWLHMLSTPFPKIKRPVLESIAQLMSVHTQSFADALSAAIPDDLSPWQRQQLENRASLIEQAESGKVSACQLAQTYIDDTDLLSGLEEGAFSAQQVEDQQQTVMAFVRFLKDNPRASCDMHSYLQELKNRQKQQNNHRGVHLTSIHKSKGLEWPVVIIPGFNAHYFPYTPETEFATPASEESERRLLYVAMTRAQQQLHLLAPQSAAKSSDKPASQHTASRFQRQLRLKHSKQIAAAIEQHQHECRLDSHQPMAPWLNRYVSETGSPLQLIQEQDSTPESCIIDSKYPAGAQQRVVHQTLGRGFVIAEDERYIQVRFQNERKIRTLDKEKSAKFLQYEE